MSYVSCAALVEHIGIHNAYRATLPLVPLSDPPVPPIYASAASAWGRQTVIFMERYNSIAADRAAQASQLFG